jgi:hypothetical protein
MEVDNMQNIDMSSSSAAITSRKKMDALISIGAGEIIENTLNKLIHYQLAKYRNNISQINRELEKFEKNYEMSSNVFYRKFESGELGDDGDFFEWSSLYENVLLYEKRIVELESLNTE